MVEDLKQRNRIISSVHDRCHLRISTFIVKVNYISLKIRTLTNVCLESLQNVNGKHVFSTT